MKRGKKKRKGILTPYLFLLPFILIYVVTFLFPAIYSFVLSFYKYKGYGTATFVGLSNYKSLLTYRTMWKCLQNTLFYFIFSFVPTMVIAFLLAVTMRSKTVKRFQNFYKPIIFMPQICAVVASALVFKLIFAGDVGVINQMLGTDIPFLTNVKYERWPVVALITWRGIGWYFIIFLAGLTTVSEDVEEAAIVDGAGPWQRLRYLLIPLMKPTFMLTFITYAIGALKLYTEPNTLLSNNEVSLSLAPYINLITTNVYGGNFGMASAAGWFLVIIILAITLVEMKLLGGEDG
ncbi:MAG: sugar ABC transporter permease [Eubacteriales bacterium]|nr:sugar ABC transporter permease [Eubacteriales bacterium]